MAKKKSAGKKTGGRTSAASTKKKAKKRTSVGQSGTARSPWRASKKTSSRTTKQATSNTDKAAASKQDGARRGASGRTGGGKKTQTARITEAQIAARAHAIWQQKGEPPDQDEQNWHEAEAQLRAEQEAG